MADQERIVWRGRRGTVVIGCGRRVTDEEIDEWSRRWSQAMRQPHSVAVLAPGMHVEAVIPHGAGRTRGGYRPRWAR